MGERTDRRGAKEMLHKRGGLAEKGGHWQKYFKGGSGQISRTGAVALDETVFFDSIAPMKYGLNTEMRDKHKNKFNGWGK